MKFTDSSINGGEESNGWLGIRVTCTDADDHAIDLVKLIYDDASTAAPDIFGDVGVVIGDDGVVYYLETDGPTLTSAISPLVLGSRRISVTYARAGL